MSKYVYFEGDSVSALTSGRRYKVLEEYDDSFNTLDDSGNVVFCLKEGCGHLDGGSWQFDDEDKEPELPSEYNAVTNPKHYMLFPDLESIQAIEKILTLEEFKGFLKGNSLKYRFRAGKKDALEQDIAKAEQYEGML